MTWTIEIIGLSGSGKSTLAGCLKSALHHCGDVTIADNLLPQVGILELIKANPSSAARLASRILPTIPEVLTTRATRRLLTLRLRHDEAVRQSSGICILTEGATHAAWGLQYLWDPSPSKRALSSLLPRSDVTVALDVPPAVARERIREKSHLSHTHRAFVEADPQGELWHSAVASYTRILAVLEGRGDRLVRVPWEDTQEDLRRVVEACVPTR